MTEYLGIPGGKGWLRKNLHINSKGHKDGKFQCQYEEYEEQIYVGMAVQPSLFMLKKD